MEQIAQLEAFIQQQADQIAQQEAEVERLKHLRQAKADAKAAQPPTFPENSSLNRTPRTRRQKKQQSPSRTPQSAKRESATHAVAIDAPGVSPEAGMRHRSQCAWRLLDGKAVYVCYHIDDVPESGQLPVPPGLQERIQALCPRHAAPICEGEPPAPEATFIRLQRELVTNLKSLFVFVEHPAVEPTNNRSKRHLRREAEIRKGARTSKSRAGAQRRSVIMTVLASLST